VKYESQTAKLALIVVAGKGPSLLGRNWLKYILLKWTKIFSIHNIQSQSLEALLSEHQPLFSKDMGLITPFAATLHVPPNTMPNFFKPRPVPFSIGDAISQELAGLDLEKQGIISLVSHSKWAAPIVPVPKRMANSQIQNLRGLQGYYQPSTVCRGISIAHTGRIVFYPIWRHSLLQA
jgi:hypothetical protein